MGQLKKHTFSNPKIKWVIIPLILCSYFLILNHEVKAETVITNSVSVSANSSTGNSTSHAAVTTIINGETVEDWSATSTNPIKYNRTITTDTKSTISTVSSVESNNSTERDRLRAMIAKLEALISLYVSLLHN